MISAWLIAVLASAAQPPQQQTDPASFTVAAQRGLDRQQIRNLDLLIRVWGFAKYHHPAGISGSRDFDAEFLRLVPVISSAPSDAAASAILSRWLDQLGKVDRCGPCVVGAAAVIDAPTGEWLAKPEMDPELKSRLEWIYSNRPAGARQHYVSFGPAHNPVFNESAGFSGNDPAVRLLSLARDWNAIRYWYPYRTIIDRNWDALLAEYVLLFANADAPDKYQSALTRLSVEVSDGHSAVKPAAKSSWSASAAAVPEKPLCLLPIDWRFIGDRLTVYGAPANAMLKPGDVVLGINGTPVATYLKQIGRAVPTSTHSWLLKRATNYLVGGDCDPGIATITFAHQGSVRSTRVVRVPVSQGADLIGNQAHDRRGPAFQILPQNIAYLKLSSIKAADVPAYMEQARKTRGLIVDIRNYPSEFVPFAIGQYFATAETPFAKFTVADRETPGAFVWSPPVSIEPVKGAAELNIPLFILVDRESVSQSEYTAMALRAVGGKVVGSATAGADGNVSTLKLPTGEEVAFTGIGVFYPDGTSTQRIGIVPDIYVEPTPEGVAASRDEVLDAAVDAILAGKR